MPFEPRFGQSAGAYSTYRPDYPPALFKRILAELPPGLREAWPEEKIPVDFSLWLILARKE
jgi:hypothetical protein